VKNRIGLINRLLSLKKNIRALSSNHPDYDQLLLRSFILTLSLFLIHALPVPASAEMKQLSEIQTGLFHINPETMEFTAKTFISDNFIDKDQADDFIKASWRTPYLPTDSPYLPADNNYPYSVIDHNALSSDLVILYKYDNVACCPYPAKAYLSRHNISISDYTNQPSPPKIFQNVIRGQDPIYHEKVKGFYIKVTNYEFTKNEWYNETETGVTYLQNADIKIISSCVTVWHGETRPICEKYEAPLCKSCLPPSDRRQQKIFRIIRMPSRLPCSNDPLWVGPPKCSCLFGPPPPERTSAAATNWSYNFHNGFFSDSDDFKQVNQCGSESNNINQINYCPTCK
jgi:hypothetical protein